MPLIPVYKGFIYQRNTPYRILYGKTIIRPSGNHGLWLFNLNGPCIYKLSKTNRIIKNYKIGPVLAEFLKLNPPPKFILNYKFIALVKNLYGKL